VILVVAAMIGFAIQQARPVPHPQSPILDPSPLQGRTLYLAPIGDFPAADAEALAQHYREKFGIAILLLPTMPVPTEAVDPARDQVIAERLIDGLASSYQVAADPGTIVIGLTSADMYIAARTWTYALSLRAGDRFAVVSSARLSAFLAEPDTRIQRLRKLVTKNIGVLYFGLEQSTDPGSVLYRSILGPADLDRASEDF
jgi:predicted Zn-dependent protease